MLALPLCVTAAILTPIAQRASPLALRTLRDVAIVDDLTADITAVVKPIAEYGLPSSAVDLSALTGKLASELEGLPDRLRAVESLGAPVQGAANSSVLVASKPEDLVALRKQATRLQRQVEEQRVLISLFVDKEQDAESRARDIFSQIDANGDGAIEFDEFEGAARMLLSFQPRADNGLGALDQNLRAQMRERFDEADLDADGMLSFDEFFTMVRGLKGNALGPLRQVFAEALEQLLDVTLQLTALSLSSELTARKGRARELSDFVDEWCALEERARSIEADEEAHECDVEITASACGQAESVLRDVATLASAISQSNQVAEEPALSPRKLARQLAFALASFKASLAFCWRGLQLMCRDVGEVSMLAPKLWQKGLGKEDISLVKRTLTDVVMLIPYAVVMIVPLTPPGHVFAFSLLNRCFPGAMPSAFTEKRQGIFEVYAKLAAEAQAQAREELVLASSLRAARWRKRAIQFVRRPLGARLRGQRA